jgi:nitrogen fixation NifU-like protein
VTLRVALRDADGEPAVADVSYDALGCSISQASASMMTEMIIGKTVREAMDLSGEFLTLMQSRGEGEPDEDMLGDAVAFEGVAKYPARIKCALLGWMAWKDATAQALDGPCPGQHAGNGRPGEHANGQAGNGRIAADAAREQT